MTRILFAASILVFASSLAMAQIPEPTMTPSPSPSPTDQPQKSNFWDRTEVSGSVWVQKIFGDDEPLAKLFSVEIKTRTGKKTMTVVEFELETPYHTKKSTFVVGECAQPAEGEVNPACQSTELIKKQTLGHFELNAEPFIRQLGGKDGDEEPAVALALGTTEIKRDGEVMSVTVYSVGLNLRKEIKLGSGKLRLIGEVGLRGLGFRSLKIEGEPDFTGTQLGGVYSAVTLEYDIAKKLTLAFVAEDSSKIARSNSGQYLKENKLELSIEFHPHYRENSFADKHEIFWWLKREQKFKWAGVDETNYQAGVSFMIKKPKHYDDGMTDEERMQLMYGDDAKKWKKLN